MFTLEAVVTVQLQINRGGYFDSPDKLITPARTLPCGA
jgi:hypothetical protein